MQVYNDVQAMLQSEGKPYGGVLQNTVRLNNNSLKGTLIYDELGRFPRYTPITTSTIVATHKIGGDTYQETLNTVYKIAKGDSN